MIWPLLFLARSDGAVTITMIARGSPAGIEAAPSVGLQLLDEHSVPFGWPFAAQPAVMMRHATPFTIGVLFPGPVPVQSTGTGAPVRVFVLGRGTTVPERSFPSGLHGAVSVTARLLIASGAQDKATLQPAVPTVGH